MLAAALLACSLSLAGRSGEVTSFVSSSGRYELSIDPDDAEQSATCRMRLDGREQWNVQLPFVLERAAVMEDGRVAGCARVIDEEARSGELLVVLLSSTGEVVARVVHPLLHTGWVHGTIVFTPRVDDLVLQPELGRFVLCVYSKASSDERGHALWTYDATSGAPLAQQAIDAGTGTGVTRFFGLRAVRDTSLLLLSWSSSNSSVVPRANNSVFQLVDEAGRVVWSFELGRDFDLSDNWYASSRLKTALRANPPILGVHPRAFELWSVADGLRISFAVEPTSDGWRVTETERGPVALDSAPPSWIHPRRIGGIVDADRIVHVFDLLGEEHARCSLGAGEPSTPLGLTHDGRVVAGDGRRAVLFGADGTREGAIELVADLAVWRTDDAGYWGVRGWRELVRCAPDGTVQLRIDEHADGRSLEGIEALAVKRDGRVAVLDRKRAADERTASSRTLSIYDASGKGIRTLPLPTGEPCRWFSYQSERVLLAGSSMIHLVDLETERLFFLDFDWRSLPFGLRHVTLSADGRELWLLQSGLERYALQD